MQTTQIVQRIRTTDEGVVMCMFLSLKDEDLLTIITIQYSSKNADQGKIQVITVKRKQIKNLTEDQTECNKIT